MKSEMESDYVEGKDGRQYQICGDQLGRRLWINADDGSAVARFNVSTGVDVHNTAQEQMNGAPECLWCTHGKPDYKTWQGFVSAVEQHFGLTLSIDAIDVTKLKEVESETAKMNTMGSVKILRI